MKANRTLLDIGHDMQALDDLLFEAAGDVSDPAVMQAVTDFFNECESNLKAKADGYAALITEMEARAQVRAEQAARLQTRARIDANAAGFLRAQLKAFMESKEIKKIETDRFRISVAGNGGKKPLDIIAPEAVPPSFMYQPPSEIDKRKIREALEKGEKLDFAELRERGTRLSIR